MKNDTRRRERSAALISLRSPGLIAIALMGAVLYGCSDSGADDAPPSPTATATAEPAATPTADAVGAPEVDGDRAYEHVRVLTQDIGARVAGSDGEIAARDYIKGVLESYGYVVTIQEFEFDTTFYRNAQVAIGGETVDGIAFRGSGSGSATGAVVAVGLGNSDEFPAGGLAGGIALIERGTLTFAEKAENAVAAGASAIIVYNNESGPFFGDATEVDVPMVAISRADGQEIMQQLSAGPLEATVSVDEPASRAFNVIAKGQGVTACETVIGGHYDSVPAVEGADDNASGTAGVIEMARVVAARDLAGAHCFVLFGAEEFGLYGSRSFVEGLSDAEINGMRAMLNLDVIGTDAPLTLIGSADMIETGRVEAEDLGVDAERGEVAAGASSDHASFVDAGVPALFFHRNNNRIHTEQDAIGLIEPASLEETITVAYAVLEALNDG
jgi:aminopeptidase YwaD